MAKVFYDKLVALEHIEKEINKLAETKEEKEELWKIVDEYVHHRMLGCILGKLPHAHHEEFLAKFVEKPHSEGIFDFLRERITDDVETFLREEVYLIGSELMEVIKGKKVKTSK
jgi:hypothetical protein